MGQKPLEKRITLGLVGHNSSGKSTLIESLLVAGKKIEKIGGVTNYDPLEADKGTTLSASVATFETEETRFHLLDTPGFGDFINDVITSVFASENVLCVVNATAGVEVQTERTWKIAEKMGKPIMVMINHMDKERANFSDCIDALQKTFDRNMSPVFIPIGSGDSFRGYVHLLESKAYEFEMDGSGTFSEIEIPQDIRSEVEERRTKLIEDIVETNEEMMEQYLSGEEIEQDQLIQEMKRAYIAGIITPVFCSVGSKNIGSAHFLTILSVMGASAKDRPSTPSTLEDGHTPVEIKCTEDEPFSGVIFKAAVDPFIGKQSFIKILSGTLKGADSFVNVSKGSQEKASHIYYVVGKEQEEISESGAGDIVSIPKLKESAVGDTITHSARKLLIPMGEFPEPMLSKSVHPKSKSDIDKISNGLSRLAESDPTFSWEHDPETSETVISGVGSVHLDVMIERLKRLFKVEVDVGKPKIAYRETVRANAETEYKHKKQTGGHGQYGHVKIRVYPKERGSGFEFAETIFGGSVPNNYIPSVEKGIKEGLKKGVLAGFPVVDIKVELYDGSYHEVDSSDMAFQIAGIQALKKGMELSKPVLLEPIMEVEVFVPDENAGDVMGEITSRRGRPLGMEAGSRGYQMVKAKVPFSEMLEFPNKLSSITSGKGYFTMKFSEYSEVPSNIQDQIILERKRALEEANK